MAHELSAQLSKFDPLPRIILYDDFDNGLEGWTGLIGNYEDTLDSVLPGYRDLRPPMLSNATMWDTGSAGALDGVYSMKLATRPEAGGMGVVGGVLRDGAWSMRWFALGASPCGV